MRARLHDALRHGIGLAIAALGHALAMLHRRRIRRSPTAQASLRVRYGITEDTPILAYGDELEAHIAKASAAARGTEHALTSGSTGTPKRIPYAPARIRRVKWAYMDAFARLYAAIPIRRRSLYIFSALSEDDGSLTAMLLRESRALPPFLSTLQAPYRVQSHPDLVALKATHGATALRLWVLALSNPGVLYATNPSTLSTFLDALESDWDAGAALVRAHVRDPGGLPAGARRIARRLTSVGADARLRRIADSPGPLTLADVAPGVEAYMCWDGGYVRPFLDRVRRHLPAERYRFVPMYSMSTETVETVPHFNGADEVAFVPLAPGVLHELLPAASPDEPSHLLPASAADPGEAYTMVVSDQHGLRRYQTEDLFECVGRVGPLPDLRFLRRRALEHSFTGEKLTGAQLLLSYEGLRGRHPELSSATLLTCLPSAPANEPTPHYRLVVVDPPAPGPRPALLADEFDNHLGELNPEYLAKRQSGRLGPPRVETLTLEAFVMAIGGDAARETWESQFKFLPLYRRRWESLAHGSGFA